MLVQRSFAVLIHLVQSPTVARFAGRKNCAVRTLTVLTLLSLPIAAQTVSLSVTTLSFGNVVIGTTSATKNVTLTNTGTAQLSITSIVASPPYAQTNTCGSSVNAGKKCTISVTFTPTVAGTASGSLTINDNASNSPQTVSLNGSGVVAVSLAPAAVNFASRTVGTTSNPTNVTLTNNTAASLTINSISVTGDFAQTNTCGVSVASKGKCTISISFTPTVVGTRTGTLNVNDSGSNSPQTASLSGSGSTTGLTSIAITPSNPSVSVGGTQQFTATGTFSGGSTYDLTKSVNWNSSKGTIATISNAPGLQGLATALAAGTATIRCSSNQITATTTLTVTSGPVLQSIAVTPAAPSIALGYGQQFTATGTYSDGSTRDLTSTVTWNSSAANVATINTAGMATSAATGTSTISATSGSISGSAVLTVSPAALLSIAVTPANATAALGTTQQYKAVGTYSDGSTLDLTSTAIWSSSSTAVASISNAPGTQGLASTVTIGSTTISATSGSVVGSTVLTVTQAVLTAIAVTPALPSIPAGTTQQFTATGTFTDGSVQDVTMSVAWSSSAAGIATISNDSGKQGLATSLSSGTSTITATSEAIAGSTTLTVTPAVLLSITISPINLTIAPGTSQQFTAIGTFTDNSTQDLTASALWASSDDSFATIGSTGLATAIADGSTTITATSGTVTGSTTLLVSEAVLVSIAISPTATSIPAGATQQFTATGTFSDSSTQDITGAVHWSSSDGTVATISNTPGTSGLATGIGTGEVTINATSGSVNGSADLTITTASLLSISIAPQDSSISLGSSQQFAATGIYSDNSSQDLTQLVTWSSSATGVATFGTQPGLVVSAGTGSTTITATSGPVFGSTTLTVSPASLVSIAVTPANPALIAGTTQAMIATGTYTDGSSLDLTNSVAWSSSDSTKASISGTGLVTGVFVGISTITATMNSISGTTLVTVTPVLRSFGTVTDHGTTSCPNGSLSSAACNLLTVSCAGLPDINVTTVVSQPSGAPVGTVILHAGGAGNMLLNNGFPADYIARGFRSVQVSWATDWAAANGVGVKSAACRPATLFYYIFTSVHQSSRSAGFCAQGSSGGGAAIAYSLAHYGMGDYFDHTVVAAGPGLTRMDYGCNSHLYQGGPLNLCSSLTDAPYLYTSRNAQMFNNWESTTTCESPNPTQSDTNRWASDSIVTSGGNYTYPQTSMSWFTCTTQPVNESTGQGKLLIDQVLPKGSAANVSCYSGVCRGESVWTDSMAYDDTLSDMQRNCVPNHQ